MSEPIKNEAEFLAAVARLAKEAASLDPAYIHTGRGKLITLAELGEAVCDWLARKQAKPTKRPKSWWIKERNNPQLGVYYVACGQLSWTEAKRNEKPLYGSNRMLQFASEADYNGALERLRKEGKRVQ